MILLVNSIFVQVRQILNVSIVKVSAMNREYSAQACAAVQRSTNPVMMQASVNLAQSGNIDNVGCYSQKCNHQEYDVNHDYEFMIMDLIMITSVT